MSLGLSEIGRALQDHEGNVKILFSKLLGISDSNVAKVFAIKEPLLFLQHLTRIPLTISLMNRTLPMLSNRSTVSFLLLGYSSAFLDRLIS